MLPTRAQTNVKHLKRRSCTTSEAVMITMPAYQCKSSKVIQEIHVAKSIVSGTTTYTIFRKKGGKLILLLPLFLTALDCASESEQYSH